MLLPLILPLLWVTIVTLESGAMLLCREFYLRVRGQGNHGVTKVLYIITL